MTTGIIHDQKHIEKQMGCMAGFFQLFDRHQILTGKRLYSTTKRLTSTAAPPPVADSRADSVKTVTTEKSQHKKVITAASPSPAPRSPSPEFSTTPAKMLPIYEFKEGTRSSWKFGKDSPRLSLDSRATVDAKGKLYPKEMIRAKNVAVLATNNNSNQEISTPPGEGDEKRRSTSVIARLMGLEPLPDSSPEQPLHSSKKPELRRSSSESRVSRDLFTSFQLQNLPILPQSNIIKSNKNAKMENNYTAPISDPMKNHTSPRPWKSPQQRKIFFDAEDFFPEPKQNISIYSEIERRLRMRGIDEPCKDLETLKQILEALQLKGLLHSSNNRNNNNFVYEQRENIVLMKPAPARIRGPQLNQRYNHESSSPLKSRARSNGVRNASSPTHRESNAKSPNTSPVRRRQLSVETQRRGNESLDQRRASPVNSPRLSPRRSGLDPTVMNRSPRNRRVMCGVDAKEKIAPVVEDESSSISESTLSTSSHTDTERSRMDEYKGGRSLLERCDKLLNSIAEMNAVEMQPSPISVLDSSFNKDESSSPSPIMKRSINFKDHHGEFDEDLSSLDFSSIHSNCSDKSEDFDFIYISDILRACNYLPEDSDVFLFLEKQQHLKGNDTSKISKLHRKLIYDTIIEILDRNRQLPPWKLVSFLSNSIEKPSLSQIWSEFEKIRERDAAGEDLFDTICGVLRKDLAGDAINGWGGCHVEMSDAVLDIERLIFKDLVGETIHELAVVFGGNEGIVSAPRRKLVF